MLNSNKEHAYSRTSTLTFAVLFSVAGLGQPAAQAQGISAGSFDEVFANPGRVDPTFMRPEVMKSLPLLSPISPAESAPELGSVDPTLMRPEEFSSLPLLSAISPDESAPELGSAVPTFTRAEVVKSLSSLPLISPAESAPEPGRVAPTFIRPQVISGLPPLPISPDESTSEPVATASTNPPEALEARDQPGRVTPSFTRPEVMKSLASALEKLVISPAEAETSLAPPPSDAPQQSEPRGAAAKEPPNQPTVTWRLPVARLITNSHLNRPAAHLRAIGITPVSRAGQAKERGPVQQAGRPKGFSRLAHLGSGRATWYQHPGRTASGEKFNPNAPTAAHKSLPLGTRVRVVNKQNRRSVVVRINDRMPDDANAKIDLSRGSARALGITGDGSVALQKAQ
jgi:rare lipoprotein A